MIVANVRELRAISHSDRKSDKVDAEKIARYARLDPKILRPISHRTVAQQEALTLIRARNLIVRLRTAAVNAVRGLAKPCGYRLPASSTLCFAKRSLAVLPPGLVQALGPVLEQIAEMTKKIKHYDGLIRRLTETEYPETQALIQVYGVGQLTALTYVLTLGSKERFQRSRDVGCYSASAGFNASAGFFASAGFSGMIAHAKPCASHKKKLAKRHTKTRPAKRNTTWPFVLATAYNPIEKKATVANEKPPAKRPSRRDKTLMRLLI